MVGLEIGSIRIKTPPSKSDCPLGVPYVIGYKRSNEKAIIDDTSHDTVTEDFSEEAIQRVIRANEAFITRVRLVFSNTVVIVCKKCKSKKTILKDLLADWIGTQCHVCAFEKVKKIGKYQEKR